MEIVGMGERPDITEESKVLAVFNHETNTGWAVLYQGDVLDHGVIRFDEKLDDYARAVFDVVEQKHELITHILVESHRFAPTPSAFSLLEQLAGLMMSPGVEDRLNVIKTINSHVLRGVLVGQWIFAAALAGIDSENIIGAQSAIIASVFEKGEEIDGAGIRKKATDLIGVMLPEAAAAAALFGAAFVSTVNSYGKLPEVLAESFAHMTGIDVDDLKEFVELKQQELAKPEEAGEATNEEE